MVFLPLINEVEGVNWIQLQWLPFWPWTQSVRVFTLLGSIREWEPHRSRTSTDHCCCHLMENELTSPARGTIFNGEWIFSGFTPSAQWKPYLRIFDRICHCSLRWRHNEHDCVSNHQPHDCLLNGLFRRRSKKTSNLRVTGLCVGNSPGPVNSPHKGPVTRKMFPCYFDVWFNSRQRMYKYQYGMNMEMVKHFVKRL